MYSCTTCRLNSMLCERCCLAMAFIFRKPRTPVKSLTSTRPAPGAHSSLRSAYDPKLTFGQSLSALGSCDEISERPNSGNVLHVAMHEQVVGDYQPDTVNDPNEV